MREERHLKLAKRNLRPCKNCDHRFDVAKSQCPSCGLWNIPPRANDTSDQTVLLSEVSNDPISRIETGPWDKCFSMEGGIVTTSVTIIGGAPGAGKSTMSLQLSDRVAEVTEREVIYIGAEESAKEIKSRAMRLQLKAMHRIRVHPMGSSADLGAILQSRKPSAIILDSLPGLMNDPEMAVEMCKRFKDYAVELNAPVIIIDHVTKDGDLAGLMALQHAVDTLMTLFPDGMTKNGRELITVKNRFGPANVVVRMDMTERGLFLGGPDDEDEDEEEDEDAT